MALRLWASSTANALRISVASSTAHLSPSYSLSRCFSTGTLFLFLAFVLLKPVLQAFFFCSVGGGNVRTLLDCAVVDGLKYASSHEWVKHEGPVATIGITDHAQVIFSLSPLLTHSLVFLAFT